ncbi:glycogen operon protein GlgX homolog [Pseudoclavibacter endophyticus]|uniref:Glycogen debranching protein GlgX n=1 Tax=Pseudoclavibacter endophyticus TaxID=1778590 RepID=A0A6H9WML1_9MICO|nr:glycogen debranching protein GlgX [Pseudoclavibacter endophyticus]KAB1647908.1 glycogen debranching protein GlgX [Pseudoclavibacter endophyticus]GGA73826.1 glycogen operon protein GlgX homolog [Pseudoclavibacter endophyticus]
MELQPPNRTGTDRPLLAPGDGAAGRPSFAPELGVTQGPHGPRLRVWSASATSMELVLLAADGRIDDTLAMSAGDDDVWEVATAGLHSGRRYAIRADGPDDPACAFDPDALLLDPYARGIEPLPAGRDDSRVGPSPRFTGVVVADEPFDWGGIDHPARSLDEVVVYEAHLAGFTGLAPHLPPELRGTYAGFAHPETIRYLRETGVNAVELLPVHAFASEGHLRRAGLTNYWGYNTVGFFAPHAAYASPAARAAGHEAIAREFKGMVRNLHEAGIEVYLDVVYNHTAEEGQGGETISFRGIDNGAYYRLDDHGTPIDVTGCGNSINASHPIVQQLVLDSLRHWVSEYRIDGFRFDLAATLARNGGVEFEQEHPLLTAIADDERLEVAKLIAEPWDVGMGGWQTGNFPVGWSEWNDRYRDAARSFWVSDIAHARHTGTHPAGVGRIVTAASGSSDLFDDSRGPLGSVNFVTAHDGFTLRDLVSYNVKHNLLNGELGRDGTNDNRSYNFGYEGPSRDPAIEADRRLAMRNLLGTLLTSAGVPMLTMGDEVARSQGGNNNPYNQDTPTIWFDWNVDEAGLAQRQHVARLLELRRTHPVLRPRVFNHGDEVVFAATRKDWYGALGDPMGDEQWNDPATRTVQCLASTLVRVDERQAPEPRPTKRLERERREASHGGQALAETPADAYDDAPTVPDALGLAGRGVGRDAVPHGYALDELLIIVHGTEDTAIVRLPDPGAVAEYSLLWDSAAERIGDIWTGSDVEAPLHARALPGASLRVQGPSIRIYAAVPR